MVKRYGPVTAVDGLTLTAGARQVTAILGPNGAGKTTTIEVCEGYRGPDAGTVRVLGLDPVRDSAALRPRVGVMLQSGGIPPAVPAGEYLKTLSRFHVKPHDPAWLLDIVGLSWFGEDPVQAAVGRAAAAPVARRRRHRPPRAGLPRRADGGHGPAGQARHLGPGLRAARRRGRGHPHHALHGRGRAAGRPRDHHRPRPRGRRRQPGRAHRVRRAAPVPRRARPGHRQPARRAAAGQRRQGVARPGTT